MKGERICFRVYFSLALLLLLLPVLVFANPEVIKTTAQNLNSLEKMKPNGEYNIEVFRDSKWQQAGSLAFDQFFSEKTVEIAPSATDETVRIKITQKGGHAAHIDAVFLGAVPPVEARGEDASLIMKKISQKDFDVMDASGKETELVFKATGTSSSLSITARIEGERISETPFQYPLANLYKKIDSRAKFYTYKLDSKENNASPFFKEYSVTGSGHPSGYTYGWVSNDGKSLHVKIDFTPDNTMDGPKDYAKVYVKTEAGIKEFKVSVPETRWGRPDFTYTDKVAYQHKVYDFEIPFTELGIKDAKKAAELQLAFAAYGTAAPSAPPSGGDFNPPSNNYLVVYGRGGGDIFGRLVDYAGNPVGAEITVSAAANSQTNPSAAYNRSTDQYFVVWEDQRSGGASDVYGQFVNSDGSLSGVNFVVSNAANWQHRPSVAYDSSADQYLVAWFDYRNSNYDIYGQLVDSNGTLSGGEIVVSTAAFGQLNPAVVYNSSTNQYLIVWYDSRNPANYDIYGQLINSNGSLSGANFVVSSAANGQLWPSAAYNSSTGQFLVAWTDDRSGLTYDIYGQVINANGTLSGNNFPVSIAANDQREPSVAYNSKTDQYLVVWRDNRSGTSWDIYGQYLTGAGAMSGGDFFIISSANSADVIPNINIGNYLVVYDLGGNSAWIIVGGLPACLQPLSGLIAWWPGDGDALDSAGTNHGTVMNGANFASGMVNQSFSLDGLDDYVSVPDAAGLNFGANEFSLSAWVNSTDYGSWRRIITKRGISGSTWYSLTLMNGIARLEVAPGMNCDSSVVVSDGQWHHLAVIRDNVTGFFRMFVDGVVQCSLATSGMTLNTAGAPLEFGKWASESYGGIYAGRIDDIQIYNRALSVSEIQAIYNASSAGLCGGPILTVKIDMPGGGTVKGGGISCPAISCSEGYEKGTVVTLTAAAKNSYRFKNWTGCTVPAGNVCTMLMNKSKTVTANFVGMYSISGKVVDQQGLPMPNVTVTLESLAGGGQPAISRLAVTDAYGKYKFTKLPNGTYKVSPGFTFNPLSRKVTVMDGNQGGVNFKLVY
ncbi:MAG: carboxypeptidase regulatory-like domain-containing protein [Nitrospirae bacterium]|nr:carboxypeptidase regulatory-like domain-containing protein [Nitrospirota bacterium]